MAFAVRYTRAAAIEMGAALAHYAQEEIRQSGPLLADIERTEAHLAQRPMIYQKVEGDIRRAVLRRFPYSIFYVIEDETVVVLAFMHQHQKPRTREQLLNP